MRIRPLLVAALLPAALLPAALLSAPPAAAAPSPAPAPPPAESAGLSIRLVDVPKARAADPRAQAYVVDHLAPGTTVSRRVLVRDTGTAPVTPTLYAGAADIRDGAFVPADKGVPGDLVAWTRLSPFSLGLAPGGESTAEVTIAVPPTATPGERYGVVWAELPAEPTGGGASEISRVGVRIYLSVGAGPEPASRIGVDSLQAARNADGAAAVTALVRNTGGRALDLTGSLSLRDGPGGRSAGPFPVATGTTVGLGQAAPVTAVLDKTVAGGPWNAVLELRSGGTSAKVQAPVSFPGDVGTAGPPLRPVAFSGPPTRRVAVLAAAEVLGLAVLLLVVAAYLARRGRGRRGARLRTR